MLKFRTEIGSVTPFVLGMHSTYKIKITGNHPDDFSRKKSCSTIYVNIARLGDGFVLHLGGQEKLISAAPGFDETTKH